MKIKYRSDQRFYIIAVKMKPLTPFNFLTVNNTSVQGRIFLFVHGEQQKLLVFSHGLIVTFFISYCTFGL